MQLLSISLYEAAPPALSSSSPLGIIFLAQALPDAKRYPLTIHPGLLETVWAKAGQQKACACLEPLCMDLVAGRFLELLFELQAFSIRNI